MFNLPFILKCWYRNLWRMLNLNMMPMRILLLERLKVCSYFLLAMKIMIFFSKNKKIKTCWYPKLQCLHLHTLQIYFIVSSSFFVFCAEGILVAASNPLITGTCFGLGFLLLKSMFLIYLPLSQFKPIKLFEAWFFPTYGRWELYYC